MPGIDREIAKHMIPTYITNKAKEKEVETRMGFVGQGKSREAIEGEVSGSGRGHSMVSEYSPNPQEGWKGPNVYGLQRLEQGLPKS